MVIAGMVAMEYEEAYDQIPHVSKSVFQSKPNHKVPLKLNILRMYIVRNACICSVGPPEPSVVLPLSFEPCMYKSFGPGPPQFSLWVARRGLFAASFVDARLLASP